MTGKPLWRQAFDAVEQGVGEPLTRLTHTSEFLQAARAVQRLNRHANRLAAAAWSRGLHLWQLPAYSDVRRLSRQLNQVERRLRAVSHQIDELTAHEHDGADTFTD